MIPKWTILELTVFALLVYDAKRSVRQYIARYMGSANQLLQCAVRLSIWWRWRVEGRLSWESMAGGRWTAAASCMGLQCGLGLSSRWPWLLFTSERRITFDDIVSQKKNISPQKNSNKSKCCLKTIPDLPWLLVWGGWRKEDYCTSVWHFMFLVQGMKKELLCVLSGPTCL
jgi:hypothetical protein